MTYGQLAGTVVLSALGVLIFVASIGGTVLLIKVIWKELKK